MLWFKELNNRHPRVWFENDGLFWKWRDDFRPDAPLEMWDEDIDQGGAPPFLAKVEEAQLADEVDYNNLDIVSRLEVLAGIEGMPEEFQWALDYIHKLQNVQPVPINDRYDEGYEDGYDLGVDDGRAQERARNEDND